MATFEERIASRRAELAPGGSSFGDRIARRRAELASQNAVATPNSDGTYGTPPDGYFMNPETGQMTSRAMLKNNISPSRGEAAVSGAFQGATFNFGDELIGAVGGAVGGDEQGNFMREKARAYTEAQRDAHPATHFGGEVAGAFMVPGGVAKTASGNIARGTMSGGMAGAGQGEGDDRAGEALEGAVVGGVFSGLMRPAMRVGGKGWRKLVNTEKRRPTIGQLKSEKTAAYRAVDEARETFNDGDMKRLLYAVQRDLADANYVEDVDTQTRAMLKILENQQGKTLSLGELDKIRQGLWARYNRSDEVGILDGIDAIDALIEQRAGSSALMRSARAANAKYKKAEMLEDAFKKARLQTASTGSGGNILNKYRQAVTSIVTNPRKAKWFSQEELAMFEHFIEGDHAENVLRRVGKLSPSGNGLMTALNVYAASVDPSMLAITGAASLAKRAADESVETAADEILDVISTGESLRPTVRTPSVPAGVAGASLTRDQSSR